MCLTGNNYGVRLSGMPTTKTSVRAAIYARISQDSEGLGLGVQRQLEDCRALAASRGWQVAEEFIDNDLSALSGRLRPGYDQLMRLVDARGADRVVVFQTSRMWRNRRERADGIERLREARCGLVPVKGTELDLTSAAGRMLAGLLGEFDTAESEVKAERVARAARQRAELGRRNGTVPYGWQVVDGEDVEDPGPAAIVREVVDRLLAGESLRGITADLNGRGIPSPYGKTWGKTSVKKLALRQSNAARRVHQGQVVGKAAWPALVDEAKHDRVLALLTDPARSVKRDGSRKHLLSWGIGECGVCGARLRAVDKKIRRRVAKARTRRNPEGIVETLHRLYVCDGSAACVGRNREQVDRLVADVVVERLSRPDARGLLEPDDARARELREEAAALRARLDTAADQYADGGITGEQLRRITARMRPRLEEVERLARAAMPPGVEVLDGLVCEVDAREVWNALPVARQRAVLELLDLRVALDRTRQGKGFDPASVRIEARRT